MSYFKAKMHQIPFRLGLRPRPHWGAYSAPQTPQLDLRGLLLRGRYRKEGRGGVSSTFLRIYDHDYSQVQHLIFMKIYIGLVGIFLQ